MQTFNLAVEKFVSIPYSRTKNIFFMLLKNVYLNLVDYSTRGQLGGAVGRAGKNRNAEICGVHQSINPVS